MHKNYFSKKDPIDIKTLPIELDSKALLHYAISNDDLELFKTIKKSSALIDDAIILAAFSNQHQEAIKFILSGDLNPRVILPLAIYFGNLEAVQILGARGFDLSYGAELAARYQQPHILKYLHENGRIPSQFTEKSRLRLEAMRREILAADPIYHPSEFWKDTGNSQISHLHYGGEANFKRTLNQSYCNFIPVDENDGLVEHLAGNLQPNPAYQYSISDPDNDPKLWHSFYPSYQIFQGTPQEREKKLDLYQKFVSQMYDYIHSTPEGSVLASLEEPNLGNPIKIYQNGKRISQDLATSVMERKSILEGLGSLPNTKTTLLAELGAGYGRLAYVMLKTIPCRYMIFDIPPALYISEWYLSTLFPDKKIFKFRHFNHWKEVSNEIAKADVAFFTPNQLEHFPDNYFDAFASISSLHEMTRSQIQHFMRLMQEKSRKLVYIRQYWRYLNPHDKLEITENDYPILDSYQITRKTQDPLNPLFFELTAVKKRTATISVLLANYNHAHFLPESLEALISQTRAPDEIIVIDDGSTDNSIEIIESFQKKFPNLRLLRNPKNLGLMISIDRALHEAKSEFIVWAASDDKLLPHFIERNLAMLEEYPEAQLSFSQLGVFMDHSYELREYSKERYGIAFDLGEYSRYLSPKDLDNRLKRGYLWMSGNTVVIKRAKLLEMGGFKDSLRWHTEWFSYYAVALRTGCCIIPETLALIRERTGTYSNTGMQDLNSQKQVLISLLETLCEPQNRDLYLAFLRHPCLFSPFGLKIVGALTSKPRFWRLLINYIFWHIFKHYRYHAWVYHKTKSWIKVTLVTIFKKFIKTSR